MAIVRLPIANVWSGGTFSAEIAIGGGAIPARLVLDTGSSSLVIDPAVYDGAGDAALQATSLAQLITYGDGGWAGPVVRTRVGLANLSIQAPVAIAFVSQGSIGSVAGILGLAFGADNPAWDFGPALAAEGAPRTTFPWPFGTPSFAEASAQLQALVQARRLPTTPVTPCLDALVAAGLIAPRFAFLIRRSAPSARLGADPAAQAADPPNAGVFVLGGGEAEADLIVGAFVDLAVVHELFYNLDLLSVRVDGCKPVAAPRLPPDLAADLGSNALIDTGNPLLRLAPDVLKAVLAGLARSNPAFAGAARAGQPVPAAQLDLAMWPDIHFTFRGADGEPADVAVAPQAYWQVDWPAAGQASFRIAGPLRDGQSNFGLPLMSGRYTVFDRARGTVSVAPAPDPD
jgi:hypothetical protein